MNKRVVDRTGLDRPLRLRAAVLDAGADAAHDAGRRLSDATPAAPIDDGPTMFDAVRELGLKLESERGPVEHLVIDSVERPTED